MLRELDIPPLWLMLALGSSWALGQIWSVSGFAAVGVGLIAVGLAVMVAALVSMVMARTTFVPRRDPQALVTGGLFAVSRNPIYLADVLILTGAILVWGAVFALPLVPLFMTLITLRYIHDEEARLRAGFGPQYDRWAARVPRWFWRI